VLRQLLLRELSAPLRSLEETFFREFGGLEHFMFRFFDRLPSQKDWDQEAQVLDSFTRLLEQRQQFFRDSPGIRRVQEKVAAVGSVNFTIRIAGYSSILQPQSRSVGRLTEKPRRGFRQRLR
jgi:hypothetical protein